MYIIIIQKEEHIFSKYLLRFGLLGTLTFLGLFIYFYKTSGKFRKSIIGAFAAATVFLSGLTTACAAGEVDGAFTQQNQQHQNRPQNGQGIFGRNPNNDGSGPGKPDDFGSGDDLPQFPQTESVEKTEERVERIDDHLRQMSEESDSGTESESEDECAARSINTNSQVKKDEVAKLSESVTKSYSEIKHELEIKQHQKTVKIDVAGKTYMIENADRMGVDELENKLAEHMYNSIRDNHKDISDIAGNLGFKADNIKNVKDHVFYNEHVLDRYAHLGDDPVVQRFDPDLKQALAWKRFEIGEHTPEDMEWLKHEYAERFIESTYDAGYTESHDRAQSHFDGNPWNDD